MSKSFDLSQMDPRALQLAAAAAAAASAASSSGSSAAPTGFPPGMAMDEATKNAMQYLLSQQYGNIQHVQPNTNDAFNLTQNAIACSIPTMDQPTILSYLGYGNSFQPSVKGESFQTKYSKLMEVIDEIGRDIRPLYAGSKGANDRLRRQIIQARHLVRECLMEVDRTQR